MKEKCFHCFSVYLAGLPDRLATLSSELRLLPETPVFLSHTLVAPVFGSLELEAGAGVV